MMRVRCFPDPAELVTATIGPNAVVIDVLRASTTICTALANGAPCIYPFPEIELAEQFAGQHQGNVLTGGERKGEKLPGFDFGNSPLEYTPERIKGRAIAFTTTNGTRAMEKCRQASMVAIGSFCNLTAIISYLAACSEVDLVCAGTDGEVSIEDCAFAGAVLDRLTHGNLHGCGENEEVCFNHWQAFQENPVEFFKTGSGGQNLMRLGRDEDIGFAAKLDTHSIVPVLQVGSWKIEPA